MTPACILLVDNPLAPAERRVIEMQPGFSLGELLSSLGHDIVSRRTICSVNGNWLPRKTWTALLPADGDLILLIDLPFAGGGGGNSNPLAIVATIAIIVLAPYAAGAIAAATGLSVTAAGALFVFGANLIVSSLAPPPSALSASNAADFAAPSPTYSLSAQGNSNRLGQPCPVSYGRNRVFPAYCAVPYAEFSGDDQILFEILDLGLGEYDVEEIFVEDTPISNFDDIEYEIVPPGETVQIVPARVFASNEVAGQELLLNDFIGPFVAVPPGERVTSIGVDIVLPKGLFYAADDGSFDTRTVSVRFEARSIDDDGEPLGPFFPLGVQTLSAASNSAIRRSYRYSVPSGRYEVRATRTNEKDLSSRAGNDALWAGLRSYISGTVRFAGHTVLAMRIRASEQLSQLSSRRINVVATRKLPIYTLGQGWSTPVATRSIAWAVADVLRSTYGYQATDSEIDLNWLVAYNDLWSQRQDYFDFTFDTRTTVAEVLTKILAAGRAVWFRVASTFTFARDEAQALPVAIFTPRNIARDSVEVDYVMPPERGADHIVARYWEQDIWAWREVICVLDDSTSEKPATVELVGIGSREQAWREGITVAARHAYRRRVVSFETELEGLILLPYDTIGLSHVLLNQSQTGEVVGFSTEDLNGLPLGTSIKLSSEIVFGEGQHYVIFSTQTGGASGPWRVIAGQQPDELVLTEPVPGFKPYVQGNQERTRFAFGTGSEVYLLGKVIPPIVPNGRTVRISIAVEDLRVHEADQTNNFPPLTAGWGLPILPGRPELGPLIVSQSGESVSPIITVSWAPAVGASSYSVEYSYDLTTWLRAAGDTSGNSVSFTASAGTLYVRARPLGAVAGAWVYWTGVAGVVPPPGRPVLSLLEAWTGSRLRVSWPTVARATSYDVEIYALGVLRRSFNSSATSIDYDAEDIATDGGPFRNIELRVRAVGATESGDWASLQVSNPQVGALTGVTFASGYLQIIARYNTPSDTDFSGAVVAMSLASGFDPNDPFAHAYVGPERIFILQTDPNGGGFLNGQRWYLRIAGFDKFGIDSLSWSDEHVVDIQDAQANLSSEEILESLNRVFDFGNVEIQAAGGIVVYGGSPSQQNRPFAYLFDGDLVFFRHDGTNYQIYKSVKRIETGRAPSGSTVRIPGIWTNQPRVMVSIAALMAYSADYPEQSQTWSCRADNLREDPALPGAYLFDAVAELQIASQSGSFSLNESNTSSAGTYTSSSYQLPENAQEISVNVSALSVRGTGTGTYSYHYRTVSITIQIYSAAGGWVNFASTSIAIGANTTSIKTATIICSGIPPASTHFRAVFSSSDASGTFSQGSDVYEYATDSVTGSASEVTANAGANSSQVGTFTATYPLPSYAPPSGWSVQTVVYSYEWRAQIYSLNGFSLRVSSPHGTTYTTQGGTPPASSSSEWLSSYYSAPQFRTASFSRNSYSTTAIAGSAYAAQASSFNFSSISIRNGAASVSRRRLKINSSSASNLVRLDGYSFKLAASAAIGVGEVHWTASGD